MTRSELFKLIGYRLLLNIKEMLLSFIESVPAGILAGTITFAIIQQYQKRMHTTFARQRRNAIVLLASYIVMMLQMTILFRPFGSIHEIDLIPFNTYGGFQYIILYGIGNLIIFLPVGILLPMIWEKMNNTKKILLAGFLGSLFIELAQLLLQCGVCQTEDLIMNTVGAGVGYWTHKRKII